jgi:hypothetical protein
MGWSLHQMNVRIVLLNRVIKQEAYVEKPQGFEVYQKETLVCRWKKILYGFKQLGAEPLMHNISVVKTFYNRDNVSEWLLRNSG